MSLGPEIEYRFQHALHRIRDALRINDGQSPRLHALFIGIDRYQFIQDQLRGAVRDAREMETYVIREFPSSSIHSLHNEDATRRSIIRAIEKLINNTKVKPRDPILIFYAGHGGRAVPPVAWGIQDKNIEVLLPQDFRENNQVITDRGLAAMLDGLASVKGDNIAVILDCCHSGSMTRELQKGNDDIRVRGLPLPKPLPDDIDNDIFKVHCVLGDGPSRRLGTASHVLLAACGASEAAYESDGQGEFTRAILKTLLKLGSKGLTYRDLIRNLPPLTQQSPRCEGEKRDRLLFSSDISSRDRAFYEVKKVGNDFVVTAGTVQGATIDTRFAIFQTQDKGTPPLGIFTVRNVQTATSTLDIPDSTHIPLPAYAIQTKYLDVHFTDNSDLELIREAFINRMNANATQLFHYSFVGREQASLEVDVESDYVVFNTLVPEAQLAQFSRLPFRVKKDEHDIVYNVIHAASEFDRLLHLTPTSRKLEGCIQVQYTTVERKNYGLVVKNGENLCSLSGVVEVTAGGALYGIEVKNHSGVQLYPHLFAFDCSDLTILSGSSSPPESHYRPPTVDAKDKDAPLQPGDAFTIGYGTGGKSPWSHFVRDQEAIQEGRVLQDAQDLGLSILKLFFTTKPWDLSPFEQASPFTKDYRGTRREDLSQEDEWDTLSLSVVIRRS
ncbi:hypothetical protein CPB86DRAFT_799679 [Serendipita vermifera]|nr:hypothetical protein CPB86DRAFT_799679 [Serendipita vermifera]